MSYKTAIYVPVIPINITKIENYRLLRTIQDVDCKWYSVKIYSQPVADWLIEQDGWRYTASRYPGWTDNSLYDIKEELYSWFVLRWS